MEFNDLKSQYQAYKADIDRAVFGVLEEARFIGGSEVDTLEEELASYVGRRHCVTCGNGTDALQLAYMAYGVGAGDAVFCPDMTFVASVEPAAMLGATPVFCDIDPVSHNLDPKDLERKVEATEAAGMLKPCAVVAVDFLGNPADYDAIAAVCERHDMILIEDAAQGMGGSRGGRKLGSFGDIAATSFFPSKPLGCYGDGGAVFTDDDDVAGLLRSIKVHGKGATKYDNIRIGVNSRLDNLQAAVLRVKLAHLDGEMKARQEVAQRYSAALKGRFSIPRIDEGNRSAYAQYILLAEDERDRETAIELLSAAGIPSLTYYPKPLHLMAAFGGDEKSAFPVAESYSTRNFGIPFSAFVSEDEQARVIEALLS